LPLIPYLGEWASISQLFWCSPGSGSKSHRPNLKYLPVNKHSYWTWPRRNSGFTQLKNGVFPWFSIVFLYVYQRVPPRNLVVYQIQSLAHWVSHQFCYIEIMKNHVQTLLIWLMVLCYIMLDQISFWRLRMSFAV
jgi:hypothetical protein